MTLLMLLGAALVAFILYAVVEKVLRSGKQTPEERSREPHPGGYVRGTIRSVLALSIMITAVALAIGSFLLTYTVDAGLAAAFAAVVAFYFGSRAVEGYFSRKPQLLYTRESLDGSKEKLEGFGNPEMDPALQRAAAAIHDAVANMGTVALVARSSLADGTGVVHGTVRTKGGATVEGARVSVGSDFATSTAASGKYVLAGIPVGPEVEVEASTDSDTTSEKTEVRADRAALLDLELGD